MDMSVKIVSPRAVNFEGLHSVLEQRPYIATSGRYKGMAVVDVIKNVTDNGELVFHQSPRPYVKATLRKDQWQQLDEVAIEEARIRLIGVADLVSKGLTYNLRNIGVTTAQWESSTEFTPAKISMDGETDAEKDRTEYTLQGVPVPVVQKPFQIGERVLQASRLFGSDLETTGAAEAGRSVAETSEAMLFGGADIRSDSYRIWGYTTFPDRSTFTISDWSDPATTPETIYNEINQMIGQMEVQERHYGPFMLYVPGDMWFQFRRDYRGDYAKTLYNRVKETNVIEDIKPADQLASGNVVMVQMTRDVVDLAIAADVSTISWQSGSQWTNFFQTFAVWVPRIKRTSGGRSGILHAVVGASS